MPTTNPRVMVVITREQDEVLEQLGRFQGRSKASYLRELLDQAMPIYRTILPMMKAHAATIEGQPVAVRDLVAKVLTGAYGEEGAFVLEGLATAAERIEAADEAKKGAPSEARAHRSPTRRAPAQPRRKRNSAR